MGDAVTPVRELIILFRVSLTPVDCINLSDPNSYLIAISADRMVEGEEAQTSVGIGSRIAQFLPGILLVILLLGALAGAQPELLAIFTLIVVQLLWLAFWYGVPWVARRTGKVIGKRT